MKRVHAGHVVIVAMLAFTVYVVVSLFVVNQDIQTRRQELTLVNAKIDEQVILNEDLSQLVTQGVVDTEYIERIAREQLNFVYPDERVFKDMVGN